MRREKLEIFLFSSQKSFFSYLLWLPLHDLDCLADNLDEICLQAGTADEGTIDIGMGHEFGDVARGDAAAVEDAQAASGFGTVHGLVELADQVDDLAGSLSGGGAPRAYGPD